MGKELEYIYVQIEPLSVGGGCRWQVAFVGLAILVTTWSGGALRQLQMTQKVAQWQQTQCLHFPSWSWIKFKSTVAQQQKDDMIQKRAKDLNKCISGKKKKDQKTQEKEFNITIIR